MEVDGIGFGVEVDRQGDLVVATVIRLESVINLQGFVSRFLIDVKDNGSWSWAVFDISTFEFDLYGASLGACFLPDHNANFGWEISKLGKIGDLYCIGGLLSVSKSETGECLSEETESVRGIFIRGLLGVLESETWESLCKETESGP